MKPSLRALLSAFLLAAAAPLPAQTVAPWLVGPLGEGGAGAMAWGADERNHVALALPWNLDDPKGDETRARPFWHLQGVLPLPWEFLRVEGLWSRDRHDERVLKTISGDPLRAARERLLTRWEERGARIAVVPLRGLEFGASAEWTEIDGEWQSRSDRGWIRMFRSPSPSEWIFGTWGEWSWSAPGGRLWTREAATFRVDGLWSRDGDGIFEGWEWSALAGATFMPHARWNLSPFAEFVLPHRAAAEYRIYGNNRLLVPAERDPKLRGGASAEFLFADRPDAALLAGPGWRAVLDGDSLSSAEVFLDARLYAKFPRLVPLRFQATFGADLRAPEGDAWKATLSVGADLPGAGWSWEYSPAPAFRATTGWNEVPAAAPETRPSR